jgi:zinc ribbon protein
MSTDITRGPKICPSCGKENPPTAARCTFCSTPLGGAIQATPTPDPLRLPSLPDEDAPISRPPLKGCAAIAAGTGVALLIGVSALVTFFSVCTATGVAYQSISPPNPGVGLFLGMVLGGLAAILVACLVAMPFFRPPRR